MTRMHRIGLAIATTAIIASSPTTSHAHLTFYTNPGEFTSALNSLGYTVDNILFNQEGSITSGTTVRGFTQGGVGLDITNSGGLVVNNAQGGAASISAEGGGTYNTALIDPLSVPSPPNTGSLIAISFNAQTLNTTGTLTLSGEVINDPDGVFSYDRDNSNGENFFGLIATGGQEITQLLLTADAATGGLVSIQDLGQFRVAPGQGGDPGEPGVVPEPSTLALAIGCIAPLAAIRVIRRRRQAKANAA